MSGTDLNVLCSLTHVILTPPEEVSTITVLTLQIRKLRHRKVR